VSFYPSVGLCMCVSDVCMYIFLSVCLSVCPCVLCVHVCVYAACVRAWEWGVVPPATLGGLSVYVSRCCGATCPISRAPVLWSGDGVPCCSPLSLSLSLSSRQTRLGGEALSHTTSAADVEQSPPILSYLATSLIADQINFPSSSVFCVSQVVSAPNLPNF